MEGIEFDIDTALIDNKVYVSLPDVVRLLRRAGDDSSFAMTEILMIIAALETMTPIEPALII